MGKKISELDEIREELMKNGMRLERHSPGDGWTRYKVYINPGNYITSNMELKELKAWFEGFKIGRKYGRPY